MSRPRAVPRVRLGGLADTRGPLAPTHQHHEAHPCLDELVGNDRRRQRHVLTLEPVEHVRSTRLTALGPHDGSPWQHQAPCRGVGPLRPVIGLVEPSTRELHTDALDAAHCLTRVSKRGAELAAALDERLRLVNSPVCERERGVENGARPSNKRTGKARRPVDLAVRCLEAAERDEPDAQVVARHQLPVGSMRCLGVRDS